VAVDLPDLRQKGPADCGPTAWKVACQAVGAAGRRPLHTLVDGCGPREIENALWHAGVGVQAGVMDVDDLRYHTKRGRPVICLVRSDGEGHWVVVGDVARGFVHHQCPVHGPRKMRTAAFVAAWWDEDRGVTYTRWGIACG
jgi:hypothetical protein